MNTSIVMTPFEEWRRIMEDVKREQGTENPMILIGSLAQHVLNEREESRKLSAIVRKLTERCRELETHNEIDRAAAFRMENGK